MSAWKTSAPVRRASANVGAPAGTTMNSWKSTLLSAWAPPLSTFIIGTGSTRASSPPRWRHSGWPASAAAAFAAASEMPRIALAPRRPLFGVPSASSIARSTASWSRASRPVTASASSPLALATACVTPLPPQASPPSRSSTASNSPVEAPDGTAARPLAPEASVTSTSTVGFPRLSRICRAWTCSISLTERSRLLYSLDVSVGGRPQRQLGVGARLSGHGDRVEQELAGGLEGRFASLGGSESLGGGAQIRIGRRPAVDARRRGAAPSWPAGWRAACRAGRRRLPPPSASDLIWSQLRRTSPACPRLRVAEHVRVAADQLLAAVVGHRPPGRPRRAPRAAATGRRPGTARRPARRAAWRRHRRGRRRPARRPPRPCAGRSSARPARGPTGTPAAAAW